MNKGILLLMNSAANNSRIRTVYTAEGSYTINLDQEAAYREAKRRSDLDEANEQVDGPAEEYLERLGV